MNLDFNNPINRKKLVKFAIIACVILLIIGFVFLKAWDYLITQKTVTLKPNNTTITLGPQKGDELAIDKLITSTNSSKKIKLKPGMYIVKYSKNSDYNESFESINIEKPTTINAPDLSYTDQKLANLLPIEKKQAQVALSNIFNTTNYTFADEHLHKQGNWYSARLVSKNGVDDLRFIAKKESAGWKIVVKPTLVISIDDYKDIPKDVIKSTNKYGYYF